MRLREGVLNAVLFALIPAGAAAAIAIYVSSNPPEFAHPSQAQALQLAALAPILAAGAFGIFLSVATGMTANPLKKGFGKLVLISVLVGAGFGAAALALDRAAGFSDLVASSLGVQSIHIAFPASAYVYTAGAIAVECLYRFIPVSILYGLIAKLLLRGRGEARVFWVLAVLSALIEPLSQAPLAGAAPNIMWLLFGFIFVFGFVEAGLWRRFGWPAPVLARLSFYALWHVVFGPLLSGTL